MWRSLDEDRLTSSGAPARAAVAHGHPAGIHEDLLAQAQRSIDWAGTLRRPPPAWDPEPRGEVFEERAFAFARRSGRPTTKVCAAILFGFIPGTIHRVNARIGWTVRLSRPDETMDDFMDRLDELAPHLGTVEHQRWYNDARTTSGRVKAPIPDFWIRNAAALLEYDGDTENSELAAVITAERPELLRAGTEIATLRTGLSRVKRVEPIQGDVREALRAALGQDAPVAANTFLDPNERVAGRFDPPSAETAARLLAIEPPYRDIAIFSVADTMANDDIARVGTLPLALHRMSIMLGRVERGDLREVRRRIAAYLDGRILVGTSAWSRVSDVYQWLGAERRLRNMLTGGGTSELKAWVRQRLPDVPRDQPLMLKLAKLHDRARNRATAARRVRADPIADNFDGLLSEIDAVAADATGIHIQSVDAHERAGECPELKFSITLPRRDGGFGDTGDDLLLDVMSVKVRDLLLQLPPSSNRRDAEESNFVRRVLEGLPPYADGVFAEQRVTVIKRADLAAAIRKAPQLGFLEPYLTGATLRPRQLPDATVQARRDFLTVTGIPSPRLAPVNVITGNSTPFRRLMTRALGLADLVVLPTAALYRGMAQACFFYRQMSVGMMRVTTARQGIDDMARGWTTVDGQPAMVSIPKLPHELRILPRNQKVRFFPLAGCMPAMKAAIAAIIAVEGGDPDEPKRLKVAKVWDGCALPPECGDDRYIAQANGCVMSTSEVRYCMSFAFGREVQPHDPRHGAATVRYDEGHSLDDIGRSMGTTSGRVKGYVKRGKGKKDAADSAARSRSDARWFKSRDAFAHLGTRGR